jgi:hypothetical protein
MFDPVVRGVSGVFKPLAVGAKFVFVGRLWVWGLSIMVSTSIIIPELTSFTCGNSSTFYGVLC